MLSEAGDYGDFKIYLGDPRAPVDGDGEAQIGTTGHRFPGRCRFDDAWSLINRLGTVLVRDSDDAKRVAFTQLPDADCI
ncbi:MAG: hypothetical protein P4L10_13605, partial [Acidobacteriaceae bacterium]|nr:hypothetical protein [Acidobacteriaceae bacterium]